MSHIKKPEFDPLVEKAKALIPSVDEILGTVYSPSSCYYLGDGVNIAQK